MVQGPGGSSIWCGALANYFYQIKITAGTLVPHVRMNIIGTTRKNEHETSFPTVPAVVSGTSRKQTMR